MPLDKKILFSPDTWPALRWPWLLIALSAGILELTALYFQYGMGLEPCVMCVYQRVFYAARSLQRLIRKIYCCAWRVSLGY